MSDINSMVYQIYEDQEAKQTSKFLGLPRSVTAHVDKMTEPQGDNPGFFGRQQINSEYDNYTSGGHRDRKIPGSGTAAFTTSAERAAIDNFNRSHGEDVL